jgi:voltage-gated potassium channel
MSEEPDNSSVSARRRRSVIAWGVIRALLAMTVLIGLYFVAPLDALRIVPLWISLTVACALLVAMSAWEIRGIATSPYPALRAIEALAITVPLYILLFASAYYGMAVQDAGSFDVDGLTRLDTLYFTVTVFSSVGFGDISALSQTARALVTVQMVLNLLVLGAGIRVFVGAVQRTREARSASSQNGA